jgi:hypothetical protein
MRAGEGTDMGVGEMREEQSHMNSLGRKDSGVKLCQSLAR